MNTNETETSFSTEQNDKSAYKIGCNIFEECIKSIYSDADFYNCKNFTEGGKIRENPCALNIFNGKNQGVIKCSDSINYSYYYYLIKDYIVRCNMPNISNLRCKFINLMFKENDNRSNSLDRTFKSLDEFEKSLSNASNEETCSWEIVIFIVAMSLVFLLMILVNDCSASCNIFNYMKGNIKQCFKRSKNKRNADENMERIL